MIDASGLHALEEFFELCKVNGTTLVLSGVNEKIKIKMHRFGFDITIGAKNITDNIDMALLRANTILKEN